MAFDVIQQEAPGTEVEQAMRRHMRFGGPLVCGQAMIVAAAALVAGASASEESGKPERRFVAAFVYPGITLGSEDRISLDLAVKNRGRSDETVLLTVVEKPEGWKTDIKGYGNTVTGVFVAAGEDKTLTFSAQPEDAETRRLPGGSYRFAVKAATVDGALTSTTSLDVTVIEKEKPEQPLTVETSYPELRGPSDQKFQYSLDVRNQLDEDALFSFKADAPPGWEVSFKPAYEEKQISSLQIAGNASKTIEVQVTPSYNAKAGDYPVTVTVSSPNGSTDTQLTVTLTGTYKIEAGTPMGLLSHTAQAGKETSLTVVVENRGSAAQREVSLTAYKPENWKVAFEPEKLQALEPGAYQQVEMKITPAEEALIGDYSVAVQLDGERATDSVEFRITVRASSTWGWIGVAIIVLVIAALAVTFKLLGRR